MAPYVHSPNAPTKSSMPNKFFPSCIFKMQLLTHEVKSHVDIFLTEVHKLVIIVTILAGQPDLTTCELDYTDDELEETTPEKSERHKSKRSVEVSLQLRHKILSSHISLS